MVWFMAQHDAAGRFLGTAGDMVSAAREAFGGLIVLVCRGCCGMGGQAGRDDGKGYGGRDHRQRVMMPGTEYNDIITVYLYCNYSVFTM